MKQLYYGLLLLVLALPFRLRAQVSDPSRATLDNLFYPLDKSQVPTGRLAEYATQLVPLDVFNGVLTDSSRTSPDGFRYIYATLASSQVSGPALPTLADLNSRTATAQAQAGSAIALLAVRADYAVVRPDAFSANLLRYQNGQVSDVPGRSQSPYLTRTAFAVAPTRDYSAGGIVSFILPSTLYTQSGGATGVSARYIDFGNGNGYQAAYWDQPISGIYGSAGTKRIKVRFEYENGGTLESHFDLTVGQPGYSQNPNQEYRTAPGTDPGGSTGNIGVTQVGTFNGVVPAIAGTRAGGNAYVTLGVGHTVITKPFIVAEGYDPSSVLTVFPKKETEYTETYFLNAIKTGPFNFYNELRNAGYDIIFIDYDDGTADIVQLAELFKVVVSRVNAAKSGTEPNVVMGISMGGLVARYGLADMQKANPGSTQTRMLILQDSPQRGANTPLGIQALVRQANINFGSFTLFDANKYLSQLNSLIDRPASQQLLLYRATDASSGIAYNTFLTNVYRPKITFAGNPPYQIIAVSNGSQCGKALFAPYTELARADASIFASPMPWIVRTRYYAQVIVNAIPANGQANRLSTLQFYAIIRLFGFINLRVNFVREDYNCPSGLLAVDGVAGGTQFIAARAQGLPASYGLSFYTPLFGASVGYSLQREFCFVPTASALDAADFTQAALAGAYVRGIASVSPSRTDGFIAQAPFTDYTNGLQYSNEFHTTFGNRNTAWVFSRMQNTAQPASYCDAECSPPVNGTITGPLTLCVGNSGPATYTSPLQGPGYTYAWSFDDCSLVTVCSGSSPTLQTANTGIDGATTLHLAVTTPCTTYNFSLDVTAGKPAEPLVVLDEQDDCYHIAYFHIANYDPNLTYTHKGTGNIAGGQFFVKVNNFTVTATSNSCGATTYSGSVSWNPCRSAEPEPAAGTSAEPAYSVYPNPASDQVTISLGEDAGRRAGPADFTVQLYDAYGKLRYSARSSSAQVQVATSELPVGLYVLTITDAGSGTETRRQLQVKR